MLFRVVPPSSRFVFFFFSWMIFLRALRTRQVAFGAPKTDPSLPYVAGHGSLGRYAAVLPLYSEGNQLPEVRSP